MTHPSLASLSHNASPASSKHQAQERTAAPEWVGGGAAVSLAAESVADPFRSIPRCELAAFFDRASLFVRSKPWRALPLDTPIAIDIPGLNLFGACAFLWRQGAENRGVFIFRNYDEYVALAEHSDRYDRGDATDAEAGCPPYTTVDFFARGELDSVVTRRVEREGLRLVDEDSYPIPGVFSENGMEAELASADLELCGAVLIALGDLALFHGVGLADDERVQTIVEIDDRLTAVVECPHPEWKALQNPTMG